MIPVRLTLLLIFFIVLMLLVLGNPVPVRLNFLFYTAHLELYKIIVGSMLLGVLGTLVYTGHARNFQRSRDRHHYEERDGSDSYRSRRRG